VLPAVQSDHYLVLQATATAIFVLNDPRYRRRPHAQRHRDVRPAYRDMFGRFHGALLFGQCAPTATTPTSVVCGCCCTSPRLPGGIDHAYDRQHAGPNRYGPDPLSRPGLFPIPSAGRLAPLVRRGITAVVVISEEVPAAGGRHPVPMPVEGALPDRPNSSSSSPGAPGERARR